VAASDGVLDSLPTEKVAEAEAAIVRGVGERLDQLARRIESGEELKDEDRRELKQAAEDALANLRTDR
jgi:F0F1-type ATP synthase alpha subunit